MVVFQNLTDILPQWMLYTMSAPLSMRRRSQIVGMSRAGARSVRIAHVLGTTRETICKIDLMQN